MNRGEMESLGYPGDQADSEASAEERHSSLKPLLRLAALRGDSEHVLRYLQLGGDVEARDQQGRTLHMLAASKGHLDLCRLIANHRLEDEHLAGQKPGDTAAPLEELSSTDTSKEAEGIHQSRTQGSDVYPPPKSDKFESEYFCAWLEEVEARAPSEDPSLRPTIQHVHELISKHVIIDKDEDWNDLARLLPSHAEISVIRELNHNSTHRAFENLIHRTRAEGNFSPRDIEVISREIEGVEDGDTFRQLIILMGEIEAVPEEDDDWLPPFDEANESPSDSEIDELEQFMQDLSSTTNDPHFHFARFAQSSVLLDRAGEERIGLLLDLSLRDAYRAIAESPQAVTSIQRLATDLQHGRVSAGQISHMNSGDDDQANESHGAPDETEGHDCPDSCPSEHSCPSELSLGRILENACSACSAWQVHLQSEHLEKEAVAAVSAMELTSSTVRRFDQEFETAGRPSPSLRRAVERVSRLEYEMFHANIRLAVHVADSYAWSTLPRMDRIQECLIGLLKAIDRFDYGRGNKFSTYAMWWLKQCITRAIGDKARVIRLPIHVMERLNKVLKAARERGDDTIEGARAQEIARISELSLNDAAKMLAVAKDAVSWDQQDTVLKIVLSTPDTSLTPEELADELLRKRTVVNCVNTLPQREAEVIKHRFGLIDGNDKTLEEIGQMFGVTRERIRQIEAKALRKMRHPSRRLGELINGGGETDDAPE